MKALLDKIPFNGAKSYILLVMYLLVLGAGQAGMLDTGIVSVITSWLEPLIGIAIAHKVSKLA